MHEDIPIYLNRNDLKRYQKQKSKNSHKKYVLLNDICLIQCILMINFLLQNTDVRFKSLIHLRQYLLLGFKCILQLNATVRWYSFYICFVNQSNDAHEKLYKFSVNLLWILLKLHTFTMTAYKYWLSVRKVTSSFRLLTVDWCICHSHFS